MCSSFIAQFKKVSKATECDIYFCIGFNWVQIVNLDRKLNIKGFMSLS